MKNLGVIKILHTSGIAESDKGHKYPSRKAKVGDIMLTIDGEHKIVSPDDFAKNYREDLAACEKEEKAANKKGAQVKKVTELTKEVNEAVEAKEELEKVVSNLQTELAQVKKENAELILEKENAEAIAAKKVLDDIEASEIVADKKKEEVKEDA